MKFNKVPEDTPLVDVEIHVTEVLREFLKMESNFPEGTVPDRIFMTPKINGENFFGTRNFRYRNVGKYPLFIIPPGVVLLLNDCNVTINKK